MKKLFLFLFAVAAFTACNNDGTYTIPQKGTYICTLEVVNIASGATANEATGVICILEEQSDSSYTLTMNEIKFVSAMPAMTIVIKELGHLNISQTTVFSSIFDPIIPYIGNLPYENFAISNFECVVSNSAQDLFIEFDCVGHTATFRGVLVEE